MKKNDCGISATLKCTAVKNFNFQDGRGWPTWKLKSQDSWWWCRMDRASTLAIQQPVHLTDAFCIILSPFLNVSHSVKEVLQFFTFFKWNVLPSVLWRCWLGSRKGIRPVKNWVVGCWHGYLSGARCRLAYGPADATATHCLLLQ